MSMPAAENLRTGSLRRRVIVAVSALLVVVLVGMGFVVNVVLGDRLRGDLRQRLADRAALGQALARESLDPQALTDRLTGQGIVAVYRSSSTGIVTGRDQGPPPRPPGSGGRSRPPNVPAADVPIDHAGEVLSAQIPAGSGVLTISTTMVEIDRTMATLTRVELAAGAATLVLTALVLALVVGVALAPLNRMTTLARRTRDGARGSRLRPRNPRTDLGRTAAAFDGMLDALERAETDAQAAEERMRRFLADASHDLRTPIAGVIATAEQLLQSDQTRAQREQRLVMVVRESQRAGRLVDDLLLMTRLDAGVATAAAPRPVDATSVLEPAVHRARAMAAGRRVVFDAPREPVPCLADADSVSRIVTNLLDNARRFTAPGGTISVTVTPEPRGGCRVSVSDTGPGVAELDRERIFDRFVRLDAARTAAGPDHGSGLGLPIARALALAMGGRLWCETGPGGRGSTFVLVLAPCGPPPPRSPLDGHRHTASDQLPVGV